MDLRKLKTLVDLVSESNVSELEITEAEGKVRIVKAYVQPPQPMIMPQAAAAAAPAAAAEATQAQPVVQAQVAAADEKGFMVKSPMVGTFYRAANPGSEPFVSVGTQVAEGDTLCIIEAMKILNEIEAERSGVIRQILIENGQPVEFGQALFVIE